MARIETIETIETSGTTQKNKGTEEVVVGRRRPRNPLLQDGKKVSDCTPKGNQTAERKEEERKICKERKALGEGLAGGSSHAARNSDRVELRY